MEIGLKRAESGGYTYSVATFRKVRDLDGEDLAAVKSYSMNFKEQVKTLLVQRAENYKSEVEEFAGAAPLELADNGADGRFDLQKRITSWSMRFCRSSGMILANITILPLWATCVP